MNGNRTLKELNRGAERALILVLCLTVTGGCQEGPDPLAKAFNAMGGRDALLELRGFSYESEGDRFESGQGLNPTADPIKASSFTLTLLCDIANDALSLDWQRHIFDPLRGEIAYRDILNGGVGYQTGNDSVFNPPGATSDRALTSDRIAAVRREFRLLNPQLYLRAAAESKEVATVKADVKLGERVHHVIEVADVVEPVELFVDAATGRVSKLETVQNDHIWGDVATEVSYGGWSTPPGGRLMFPHQAELSIAGTTIRTARRRNVLVNPDFSANAFALPEEPRTQIDPAAAERGGLNSQYLTRWHALGVPNGDKDQTVVVATALAGDPSVQHLTGGFHHSLAVKLDDGLVIVEPPLNAARSRAVLKKIDELWPGVPVSHLILTHHHFDHMGGIRTYAAAGATIVTSELNSAYVEAALTSSHTLASDGLAGVASPKWRIEKVAAEGEFSLDKGGRSVRARHAPTIHSEDMLVIYVSPARALFVSDLYMPGVFPSNQPVPAPFGAWTQGLREGLAPLEWRIEWIAGGHGSVAPFTDLRSHVGFYPDSTDGLEKSASS